MIELIWNKIKKNPFEKSLTEKIKLFLGKEYLNNKLVIVLVISCIIVNIIDWLILAIILRPADNSIITLHYNVYFGRDLIGEAKRVYFLPFVGLVLLLINFSLSIYFYRIKERIATYIFLITTLSIQLSLLISIISVIIVNY